MAVNLVNGWTAQNLAPNAELHNASLGSRTPTPVLRPEDLPTSVVGPINAYASMPLTAESLRLMQPDNLNDPSLGSRTLGNPLAGARQVAAQASTFEGGNIPAKLQNAIANLNAEQALRRSAQAELTNRIFQQAQSGNPDAYLWQEALRAISVNPGAHVNFGAAVQNPLIGQGYQQAANAYAGKTALQTRAISDAQRAQANLADLTRKRAMLGGTTLYQGSPQQRLDQQLVDATLAAAPNSSLQLMGRSANASSGWVPSMPTY